MSPLLILIVAVLATTYSGPIVRFAAAPALAIAFWRLALVLPVTGLLAWGEGRGERSFPVRREVAVRRPEPLPSPFSFLLMFLAGVLLACHFWSWIASLRFTTVASSVVLVSLKPVFAWALAAIWLREYPTRAEAGGIGLAVLGASLIGLGDARLSLGALAGDALAVLGALTGAGYYVIGRRVRQSVGIWRYATGVYTVAAAALFMLAVVRSTRLVGFAGCDWAVFGAMAAGPMLIGHTGMNYALRHFRATTVNVAALGEPVGASLIAWLVPSIREVPRPVPLIGAAAILLGIGFALWSEGRGERGELSFGAPTRDDAVERPSPLSPLPGEGRNGGENAR